MSTAPARASAIPLPAPPAEISNLRRALEALLDLGRHILAKGFADGVSEYKEIAFYDNVSPDELYQICTQNLADVEAVVLAIKRCIRTHPERMDETL